MGYRSEVIIAVKKKVFDTKGLHLKKNLEDCDSISLVGDHFDNIDPARDDNRFYVFCWENVKWYDGDSSVADIMEFLLDLNENDYGFIRLGEDQEDSQTLGCPWDFEIYLIRKIDVPTGKDHRETFFAENSVKFIKGE